MITILIKTFKRPEMLARLLRSIKHYQPDIPYIVLDDDEDMGVSAGRNKLVNMCPTEYCMILDDDCIFTPHTDLKRAVEILKERDLDILELDSDLNYHGLFETKDGVVAYAHGNHNGLYDFVTNIFIAKTDVLKKYPWDERFKIGEHFAYFYKHRGRMKIGATDEIRITHEHVVTPEYLPYRRRALDYVRQFMRENGISKRIDLNNEVVTL